MRIRLTHISTATLLIEIGSVRLLTDPVFDPAGGEYNFGLGTGSKKLTPPTVSVDQLGHIDAVLLSHDQHEDNLDKAGRAFLPQADRVLTTRSGERRLRGNATGLANWQSATIQSNDTSIKITATPAQHGDLIVRPFSGETIGFLLEWPGQSNGALYITGDTIFYHGIEEVARRYRIDVALLHLGRASFPLTGPLKFTMDAADGVRAARVLNARTYIPIHYDGWTHFREPKTEIDKRFAAAGLSDRLRWIPQGRAIELEM